jgi:hypothetical protein
LPASVGTEKIDIVMKEFEGKIALVTGGGSQGGMIQHSQTKLRR